MNILIKLTCLVGLVIAPILGGHGSGDHDGHDHDGHDHGAIEAPVEVEPKAAVEAAEFLGA